MLSFSFKHGFFYRPIDGIFVGQHTVTITRPGYARYSAVVEVDVGVTATLQVDLKPLKVKTLLAVGGEGSAVQSPIVIKKSGLSGGGLVGTLTLASLGVASGAVAGVFTVIGFMEHKDANESYSDMQRSWNNEGIRSNLTETETYKDSTIKRDRNYTISLINGSISAVCIIGAVITALVGWESPSVQPSTTPDGQGVMMNVLVSH